MDPLLLLPVFFLAAMIYASVGHGGASAYLAILVLAGFAIGEISTTALVLNLLVSLIAFQSFWGEGFLHPRLLLPLVATSVPAAFVGGLLPLEPWILEIVLAVALALVALRLGLIPVLRVPDALRAAPPDLFLASLGLVLGLLAGMVGIGGGVFLSPILILAGWATSKQTAAIAATFIFLNSLSGLTARVVAGAVLDGALLVPLAAAVLAGGFVGARIGAAYLPPPALNRTLAVVLCLAAGKLVVG